MSIYIVSFLIILFFNVIRNRRSLHVLQLNKYNENNRYIKWIIMNAKDVFLSLDLLALITIIIAYIVDNKISKVLITIAIVFYLLDAVRILNNKKNVYSGKRFIVTKRVKRLIATTSFILMLPVITYIADRDNILLMILIESILTYFSYILILIVNYINLPFEKLIRNFKEVKAKNRINRLNINTIGVIGTRGKTDLKRTLNEILNNCNVTSTSTPKNLNTKQGLVLTINNVIKENDKFFITELNTENKEELANINDILKTKYIILTTTDTLYLDNIKNPLESVKSKFDLINNLPSDGLAILNKDDNKQKTYHFKGSCKKIWIGINNKSADIYAENIKYDSKGTKFDVVFKKDDTKYSFETRILGINNLYNILASIALCSYFDISMKKIQKAIKNISPIRKRLGIKDCGYMYQINDYIDPTPSEIEVAFDVLKSMNGKKVIVTKGLTSNQDKAKLLNHTFGNKIAKVADMVILISSKNSKEVFVGLIESDYDKNKLYVVNNLKEAYNLLQSINEKNVYALFENIRQDDIMNKE